MAAAISTGVPFKLIEKVREIFIGSGAGLVLIAYSIRYDYRKNSSVYRRKYLR